MILISWVDIRKVFYSVFYRFLYTFHSFRGLGEDRYGIDLPQSTFSPLDSPKMNFIIGQVLYIIKDRVKKIFSILEIDISKTRDGG